VHVQRQAVRGTTVDHHRLVKCLVWDLDNALWNGILLENGEVSLREGAWDVVQTLDSRGILQSIASRNDEAHALANLRELGLDEYFLYPQINWNSKVESIRTIARSLDIGLDAIAFIDDDALEREEVRFSLPAVMSVDPLELTKLLGMPEFNPPFITEDSRRRRSMYLSDIERNKAQAAFVGPDQEFLATLEMRLSISRAQEDDLRRAEELTLRTNQLNTTGITYSYEELDRFRQSPRHDLLVADLKDKYGNHGKIGLALVERQEGVRTIKLLLMSCRVISRGVGTIILNYILARAKSDNVRLRAEFVPTGRNRIMHITFRFAGFREVGKEGNCLILEHDLRNVPLPPRYVSLSYT
jgi:FkbH-like protein